MELGFKEGSEGEKMIAELILMALLFVHSDGKVDDYEVNEPNTKRKRTIIVEKEGMFHTHWFEFKEVEE